MIESKLLIIDTETGGLDVERHSILSLGAVVWLNREIVDEIEIFIREPLISTDAEAMEATGFDLTQIETRGKCPEDAVRVFSAFLVRNFGESPFRSRIPVGGHNVAFDLNFCERLYRLSGNSCKKVFSHRVLDTASILAFLILAGRLPTSCASSSGAFSYFGISFKDKQRHTAIGDARATADLLSRLLLMVEGS